ncbi:MAG TPA: hypothetical protein VGQ83_24805 [Polyangia bacterium]
MVHRHGRAGSGPGRPKDLAQLPILRDTLRKAALARLKDRER